MMKPHPKAIVNRPAKLFEPTYLFAKAHLTGCSLGVCVDSGSAPPLLPVPNDGNCMFIARDYFQVCDFPILELGKEHVRVAESIGEYCPLDDWHMAVSAIQSIQPTTVAFDFSAFAVNRDLRPLLTGIIRSKLVDPRKRFFILELKPQKHSIEWSEFCASSVRQLLQEFGLELTSPVSGKEDIRFFEIVESNLILRDVVNSLNVSEEFRNSAKLIITTEDADLEKAGGIGTYVKTLRAVGPRAPSVLYVGSAALSGEMPQNTVHWGQIFKNEEHHRFIHGNKLIELIRGLLVLLPQLQMVEVQDAGAIGFRLIQAKKTGGLPAFLDIELFLHGGTDHVKFGIQDQRESSYSYADLRNSTQELYSAKFADCVTSPSRFLAEELSNEFGYQFNNLRISKLPYAEIWPNHLDAFGEIKNIAFVGKFSRLKGWPDFVEAVKRLSINNALSGIEKISAYGSGSPSNEEIEALETVAEFSFSFLNHGDFLGMLEKERATTLFVLPQRGENYPLTTLEMVLWGTRFVGYEAGGAPEILGLHISDNLVKPNVDSLTIGISHQLELRPEDADLAARKLQREASEMQKTVNLEFSKEKEFDKSFELDSPLARCPLSIAVATPVFRTSLDLLQDLSQSLRKSSVLPSRWVFIDEGSDPSYTQNLVIWASGLHLPFPVEVIKQRERGLAGARNTGLHDLCEDLIYFMDGDDLFLPNTIKDAKYALENFDDLAVVAGFTFDLEHWRKLSGKFLAREANPNWMPLGIPEGKTLGFAQNEFIPSSSCVRRVEILNAGGWDGSDNSAWEDWAFYLKLSWMGVGFSLLPHSGYLYRDTPGSLSKTSNNYFGFRRLVRNLPGFTPHDANVLLSFAQSMASSRSEASNHFLVVALESFITRNANRLPGRLYRRLIGLIPASLKRFIAQLISR